MSERSGGCGCLNASTVTFLSSSLLFSPLLSSSPLFSSLPSPSPPLTPPSLFRCPHCRNQKEMFGAEAYSILAKVECAENGYNSEPKKCTKIDGYPAWIGLAKKGEMTSGEMPLASIARVAGFEGFDGALEKEVLGGGSCE